MRFDDHSCVLLEWMDVDHVACGEYPDILQDQLVDPWNEYEPLWLAERQRLGLTIFDQSSKPALNFDCF